MMKKTFTFYLSLLMTTLLFLNGAHPTFASKVAQTSTSSSETTQKLRERIEKIVEEKKDQIQGAIEDLSQQKRGFIGEVQRVTEETITVKNHKGTQIISVNEDMVILKAGKSIDVESIAVGDWLVVIGTIEDDVLVAKRILVSGETLRPRTHTVALGSVVERTAKELTVLTRKGETVTFTIATTTEYQDQDGEKAKATEFVEDMQVLVVGYETDGGKTATKVRSIVLLELLQDNE
jgi:hypothetical protein